MTPNSKLTSILCLGLLLVGCSGVQVSLLKDHEGDLFPYQIPLDSLRVMQVMNVEKATILDDTNTYEQFIANAFGFVSPYWNAQAERLALSDELAAANIAAEEMQAGYILVGRVYCCGGVQETVSRQYAFAAQDLEIKQNDFVEVRFGSGNPGMVNMVTRVVSGCDWVPNNPNLWVRIPYCTWMEAEGWVEKSSNITASDHAWIKTPASP